MVDQAIVDKEVARAVGQELRIARQGRNWSRVRLAAQLPSGIGERTLLSYEHGARSLTVTRLVEICQVLDTPTPEILAYALQCAQLHLNNLTLHVDLKAVLHDDNLAFRVLHQWARNKLNRHPDGVALVEPVAVQELADFIGHSKEGLRAHLARFLPDSYTESTSETSSR